MTKKTRIELFRCGRNKWTWWWQQQVEMGIEQAVAARVKIQTIQIIQVPDKENEKFNNKTILKKQQQVFQLVKKQKQKN